MLKQTFHRNKKTNHIVEVVATKIMCKRKYVDFIPVNLESVEPSICQELQSRFLKDYEPLSYEMLKTCVIPVYNVAVSFGSGKSRTYV